MATLLKTSVTHDGKVYEIAVDFDAEAYAQSGDVSVTVDGTRIDEAGDRITVAVTLAVSRAADDELWLKVTANEIELLSLPLADLIDSDTLAGQIVEALPVQIVDPFLACLVRSGVSAAIDQIADCWDKRPREADLREIAGVVLGCLYGNRFLIGVRTLVRTGRCAAGLL